MYVSPNSVIPYSLRGPTRFQHSVCRTRTKRQRFHSYQLPLHIEHVPLAWTVSRTGKHYKRRECETVVTRRNELPRWMEPDRHVAIGTPTNDAARRVLQHPQEHLPDDCSTDRP